MRILLTNDDGIRAPGIQALYVALRDAGHSVSLVAPLTEKSGVSGTLTVHTPLRVHDFEENGLRGLAVDGTPVDCVKLALTELLAEKPDLVASGINNGSNLGADVFYSGTVAAATEGCMFNIPAVAVSRGRPVDESPEACARHAAKLISEFNWAAFPSQRVLNVNYPRRPLAEVRGVRAGRMAMRPWNDGYEKREDPFGHPYWWLAGYMPPPTEEDTDIALVRAGFVAVTPLLFDRTDGKEISRLNAGFGDLAACPVENAD